MLPTYISGDLVIFSSSSHRGMASWGSTTWGLAVALLLPAAAAIVVWALRILDWAWRTPRRLERELRAQGLKGTPFRFPYGDLKLNSRLHAEAHSKPMPLSHGIIPRVQPFLQRILLQYGKMDFSWHGPVPRMFVWDPEMVREILFTKYSDFEKPDVNPLTRVLVRGVISYEGEKWAKHRKILNPAFHMEKLKGLLPAFSICCSEMMRRWEDMVGTAERYEIDVWSELQNLTGNIISKAAFGSSYEDGVRIHILQSEQAQLVAKATNRLTFPGYKFLPTEINRRSRAIDRKVREILGGIIKKREEEIRLGKSGGDDLLGLMIESNMRQSRAAGLSVADVMEECKLFYFAGQETTSVLLTWTMIVLSMHPSWQVRAREEVLRTFGKDKPADAEELNRLKIVPMILLEVLRLYPPATILQRYTYKPVKVGDVVYPAGVLVTLPVVFIHTDPAYWGEDAGEFNPERFANGITNASKEKNVYFPFGVGPRICIGQNFAMMEAKIALCMILQRFSFELSPSYAHAPYVLLILNPQHGAQIMLRRI